MPSVQSERDFDAPTYWFAMLRSAQKRGNLALSRKAATELDRLGVRVEFGERAPQRKEAAR